MVAVALVASCGGPSESDGACKDHCANSTLDCGEEGADCGGSCETSCSDPCADHCANARLDCGEEGVDCGGTCGEIRDCGTGGCTPDAQQSCYEQHGTGTQTCNASGSWGTCGDFTSCDPGYDLQDGACVAQPCSPNDVQSCQTAHGTGTQTCNASGTWDPCGNLTSCDPGYSLQDGACVAQACMLNDVQSCQAAHGTGTQTCNANGSWDPCGNLTSCDPGYRLVNGACPAINQPPLEFDSADRIGMDITCNSWAMDAASLADCEGDLDLVKGLGIGLVRIVTSWYMMTDAAGNLNPPKVAFLKALMNAARAKGMKILYLVNLEAPASAYDCPTTQQKPTGPSIRLDFCDAAFSKYFTELMDVVLPFTGHIELFNETNWNYSESAPYYSSVSPAGYIIDRSVQLNAIAQSILQQKRVQGYQTALHSQGIAYFYDSNFPTRGWAPPASMPLIEANAYVYYVQAAGAGGNFGTLDVVDFHPYFNGTDYETMVTYFLTQLNQVVGSKFVWATETNSGGSESDQIIVFNKLTDYLDANWIQKAFWYVVRSGYVSGDGDAYSLYDVDRNLIKPNLAATIKAKVETVPYAQRFLPSTYGPVE